MPAAVNKNGLVKKDMQLISLAVSHVCSMTRIEMNSKNRCSLQREAVQQYLAGHRAQKDLIDILLMSALKEQLHAAKVEKHARKTMLLAKKPKRKAPE